MTLGFARGAVMQRERESLIYQTNTSNTDSFSLISYIYRKIPEPDPNRFYRLFPSVAYPFSYPFSANRLSFPQEYTVVIENKNFSEKTLFFSGLLLFVFRHIRPCPPPFGSRRITPHPCPSTPRAIFRADAGAPPALPLRLCVMPTFERSVNSPQEDFPLRK